MPSLTLSFKVISFFTFITIAIIFVVVVAAFLNVSLPGGV